jgi:AcrR family transcriptional regulator
MTHLRITIRYASGDVEHRYESTLPKVGDRLGRNGSEGFVTRVEADGPDHASVSVGTPASEGVVWDDLNAPETRDGETARARERILDTAYELFSTRGIRAVGTEEVLAKAGVAKSTLYRHFPSKEELVLAFLQRREHRWTRAFVEEEAKRRGSTPRERLLAIFDAFDEWFHRDDFEGCSFIKVLLEMDDLDSPLGKASADEPWARTCSTDIFGLRSIRSGKFSTRLTRRSRAFASYLGDGPPTRCTWIG